MLVIRVEIKILHIFYLPKLQSSEKGRVPRKVMEIKLTHLMNVLLTNNSDVWSEVSVSMYGQ